MPIQLALLISVSRFASPLCAGMVTSEERKREVYSIAQEYDLLIVEDDPYYVLQYREGVGNARRTTTQQAAS